MAALCTGNYGLTQNCMDRSKEYYFVKLTDSALRAVEEYQKNQGKHNTQPTIQIDGNSGVISFPSSGQQFRFSIDEIEGSFECIKQTQNQLEVQGSLPFKLRIHANDDVYETTKHRMAVAEENQKNKCTREIKPNQTDIGRKVKLKSSRHANIPSKRDLLLTSSSSGLSSLGGSASSQSPLSSSTTLLSTSSSSSSTATTNLINPAASSITHQHQQYSTGNPTTTTMSPLSTSSGTSGYSTSCISPLHSSSMKSSAPSSLLLASSSASSLLSNNSNNMSNSSLNSSSSSKLHSSYHNSNVTSASSLSSALSSAAGSGTSGISSSYYGSNSSRGSNGIGSGNSMMNSASRRSTTGTGMNPRNQRTGSRHMPDISKKKLRDRLIHMLALKPYKKPELYARLQNEGIREREKASINVILKEISTLRDNTYNLKRQMWNDVNEDWPFYNEQELQMLKRRKPQNLTPPISSDGGSSTSGQSPTSTHNGSPPPAVKRPSLDRDRFYEEPVSKKTRISHIRNNGVNRRSGPDTRDLPSFNSRSRENHDMRSSSYYGSNVRNPEPEVNAMSLSYSVLGKEAARLISPRDETNLNGHSNSNMNNTSHHHSIMSSSHHHINNNTNNHNNNNNTNSSSKNSSSSNSILSSNCGSTHHKSSPLYSNSNRGGGGGGDNCNNSGNNGNRLSDSRQKGSSASSSISSSSPRLGSGGGGGGMGLGSNGCMDGSSSGDMMIDTMNNVMMGHHGGAISPGDGLRTAPSMTDRNPPMNRHSNENLIGNQGSGSMSHNNSNNSRSSAIDKRSGNGMDGNGGGGVDNSSHGRPIVPASSQRYDFSEFKSIDSVEQRRKYKAEFERNYAEYRELLQAVEGVAKKFKMLALELEENKNNPSVHREIRRKILNEYEKTNRDRAHQKAKARFDYLHAKLAHIKGLVHDFDQTLTSSGGNNSGIPTQSPLQQNIGSDSSANDNFGNMNMNGSITKSPSLSRRNGGNLTSSSHRTSSPIINGNLGNSPPGLHHHLSENY